MWRRRNSLCESDPMSIPAFQRTAEGYADSATGIEHYDPRDRAYSRQALSQIKSNAIDAYNAAARLLDTGLPWEATTRKYEEQRLADAVRAMADVQAERVEKGWAK
jgi:hypothetical protein